MTPEQRKPYIDMCNRVFVRALRDLHGDNEYELSEGQATSLLCERERAAILSFLDGEDVVEACARALAHEDWTGESAEFRATRLEVNTEKAQRAIAALRALVQEEK